DGTARVWDARTGAELSAFRGVTAVDNPPLSFSPDGTRVAGVGGDAARVYDANTGAELLSLKGHPLGVCSAVYSTDGLRVVTAGVDGTIRVWDARLPGRKRSSCGVTSGRE